MLDHITSLANGVVVKACAMPDTHCVTLLLALKGSAAWEPFAQKGITHLVEHLCFRRAGGASRDEVLMNVFYKKAKAIRDQLGEYAVNDLPIESVIT